MEEVPSLYISVAYLDCGRFFFLVPWWLKIGSDFSKTDKIDKERRLSCCNRWITRLYLCFGSWCLLTMVLQLGWDCKAPIFHNICIHIKIFQMIHFVLIISVSMCIILCLLVVLSVSLKTLTAKHMLCGLDFLIFPVLWYFRDFGWQQRYARFCGRLVVLSVLSLLLYPFLWVWTIIGTLWFTTARNCVSIWSLMILYWGSIPCS